MSELFITPIQPWESVGETDAASKVSAFKGIFSEAISNVKDTEETLAEEQYLLATGQTEDPHTVMIASSEAQLAVEMLVNLRNKALESYNEIMRITL